MRNSGSGWKKNSVKECEMVLKSVKVCGTKPTGGPKSESRNLKEGRNPTGLAKAQRPLDYGGTFRSLPSPSVAFRRLPPGYRRVTEGLLVSAGYAKSFLVQTWKRDNVTGAVWRHGEGSATFWARLGLGGVTPL